MAILKDKSTGKISSLNFCYYCDQDTYPKGKPIVNDKGAILINNGWKCSECITETNQKV